MEPRFLSIWTAAKQAQSLNEGPSENPTEKGEWRWGERMTVGKSSQGPVLEFNQVPAVLVMTVNVTGNPAEEITAPKL